VALIGAGLVTLASVASRAFFGAPIQGDIELVEIGMAVAAFSFLPYCQIRSGHVVADIFTARAPRRLRQGLDIAAALVMAGVAALLAFALASGGLAVGRSGEDSMVLRIPGWAGYLPAAISALLLALAAMRSALRAGNGDGAP
jgi:TRAP-type C4-dicarboxylate transport system permease small subunit